MPGDPLSGSRPDGLRTTQCRQFKLGVFRAFSDVIAPEIALELHWPGRSPRKLLAFPENIQDLVVGHALLECCEPGQSARLDRVDRVESSQTGGAVTDRYFLTPQPAPVPTAFAPATPTRIAPKRILDAMAAFIAATGRWDHTGCFHRAAFHNLAALANEDTIAFDYCVEDIGRHNCIDRLTGYCCAQGLDPAALALFVSARVTGSLADKIVRAGFRCVVSRSAVTTAGVSIADAAGLTLVGFARADRFTVFTDAAQRFGAPV